MFELYYPENSILHQELLRTAVCPPQVKPDSHVNLRQRFTTALGDTLIRVGQRLKESPSHLETEPASFTSLTITL